jgi:hypothetical protein
MPSGVIMSQGEMYGAPVDKRWMLFAGLLGGDDQSSGYAKPPRVKGSEMGATQRLVRDSSRATRALARIWKSAGGSCDTPGWYMLSAWAADSILLATGKDGREEEPTTYDAPDFARLIVSRASLAGVGGSEDRPAIADTLAAVVAELSLIAEKLGVFGPWLSKDAGRIRAMIDVLNGSMTVSSTAPDQGSTGTAIHWIGAGCAMPDYAQWVEGTCDITGEWRRCHGE